MKINIFWRERQVFPTVTRITSEKCEPKVKVPILEIKKKLWRN
jgi:hypothetical protein